MRRLLTNLVLFVKAAFTENVGLKAIALAFAIGLFIYLHGQHDEQQRTIPVDVVLRLPSESAQRVLMTQIPASVHVTLRGSTRAIDRLIQTGIAPVEVDLRDGQAETLVLNDDMFSIPPGIEITIIDPASIDLEWQDVVTRQIPIQASITGQPARNFMVKGEPEVDPTEITVRGPSSLVEVMQFARLAPFDVTGLTEGGYRRRIAVDAPPNRVKYIGPQSATVIVTIARRVTEAKFASRPVEVIGLPGAITSPRAVDVTVTGPPEVVRALRPEQVVPRADLTKLSDINLKEDKHGSVEMKLTVDLAHAEAEIQPPTITVRW